MTWVLEAAPIPDHKEPGTPTRTALTMVLLGMANHADREGRNAFCGIDTLAAYGRMSRSTVKRCITVLLDSGLITRGDQAIPRAHLGMPNPPKNYNLSLWMVPAAEPVDNPEIQQGQPEPVTGSTGSPVNHLTGSKTEPTGSKTTGNRFTGEPLTVHEPPIEPLFSPNPDTSLADNPDEQRFIPRVEPTPPPAATPADIDQARREQHERNARHLKAIKADLNKKSHRPERAEA